MNEVLDRLRRETDIWCDENYRYDDIFYDKHWEEKFGELIVKECARTAAFAQAEDMDWDIAEIIKEHFGVE